NTYTGSRAGSPRYASSATPLPPVRCSLSTVSPSRSRWRRASSTSCVPTTRWSSSPTVTSVALRIAALLACRVDLVPQGSQETERRVVRLVNLLEIRVVPEVVGILVTDVATLSGLAQPGQLDLCFDLPVRRHAVFLLQRRDQHRNLLLAHENITLPITA